MIFKRTLFNYCFLLSLLIFIIAVTGCSDSIVNSGTGSTDKLKAVTENEFYSNAGASATPGAVIYVDLENLNAPPDSVNGDTGAIGEDVIPYTYTAAATHRIQLDAGAMFKARLVSEAGAVVYQLNTPGDTARVTIPAGKYKLYLTSTISMDGAYGTYGYTQPVFIQPDSAAIASGAGAPPQGGYDPVQLNQLLATKKCVSCNLDEVIIIGKDLSGANLSSARLSNSNLTFVNFTGGNFNFTIMQNALVSSCSFKSGSFNKTILHGSNFTLSDFSGVNVIQMNWVGTVFNMCDFRGATMRDGGAREGSWYKSDFSNASFFNGVIDGVPIKETKMVGTVFSNVQLFSVNFRSSVMDSLKLINSTYINNCSFDENRMRYAEIKDLVHQRSSFAKCDFTGAKIFNSGLVEANFRAANLSYSLWNNVIVDLADFCETNRTGAVFTNIRYVNPPSCWP